MGLCCYMQKECDGVSLIGGIGIDINSAIEYCIKELIILPEKLFLYTPQEASLSHKKAITYYCGEV